MDKKLEESNQTLADSQSKENGTNEHSLEEKIVTEVEPKNNEKVKQVEKLVQPIGPTEKTIEQQGQSEGSIEEATEQQGQLEGSTEKATEQQEQMVVPKDTVARQPKQQITTIQQSNPSKQKEEKQNSTTTNGKAITGLILGITGLTIPYLGFLTAIVGIVFSSLGLKEIKNTQQSGKGLAIAGLVLGIISISLYVIVILFLMFFFMIDSSY